MPPYPAKGQEWWNPTILHPREAIPMLIRVAPDARQQYQQDDRWSIYPEEYREWAGRIMTGMQGRVCRVITGGHYAAVSRDGEYLNLGAYLSVELDPVLIALNLVGLPEEYTMMQIPTEYVSVLRSGFWRAS